MADEPLRFADILTTASAVANYLGVAEVSAAHLVESVALLREEKTMADLGPALSPLVRRRPGGGGGVEAGVRELVQRWFEELGRDPNAEMDAGAVAAFVGEALALDALD